MNSPPKLILHIGQHKTGSKALQSFLAFNASRLTKHNICYSVKKSFKRNIHAYAISHYRLFALLYRETLLNCGDIKAAERFWIKQQTYCQPFTSLRELFQNFETERIKYQADTIIVSAEDLFDMCTAHDLNFSMSTLTTAIKILAELIKAFNYQPVIVVYLRRQDHLLAAHYAQYIKGSDRNNMDFSSFAAAFAKQLCYSDILTAWANEFGTEAIKVRSYESSTLPNGIVQDFFEQLLGFAVPEDWPKVKLGVESVNASPNRDLIEFIRILNRRQQQGLAVYPRNAVLAAALALPPSSEKQPAIAAWLSPQARRELLSRHAEGNQDIAHRFLGETLFKEALPEENAGWREYSGLSAETAIALSLSIQPFMKERFGFFRRLFG